MKLLQGDCLELMKDIPDGSVDLILCDMLTRGSNYSVPYATKGDGDD